VTLSITGYRTVYVTNTAVDAALGLTNDRRCRSTA